MLEDKSLGKSMEIDQGIAAQSIFLGATEMGLGGCYIGNMKKDNLRKALNIDDNYDIALVIALGYTKEEVVIENINEEGDVKYWRDEKQVHHVPKRSLEQLIVQEI
jgi:nitroreductase